MKYNGFPGAGLLIAGMLYAVLFLAGSGTPVEAAMAGRDIYGFAPGQAFPSAQLDRLEQGEDGYLQYQFDCPDPSAPFGLVKVRVSPRTHLVVDVSAAGIFHDCKEGQNAFWPLKEKLEGMYGKSVKKRQTDGDRYEITQKGLRVLFYLRSATFEDHCILYANFMDLKTFEKSGKEARAVLERRAPNEQP